MEKPMKFLVVFEQSPRNFGAYSPDLPGCIATGDTLEETEKVMRLSIKYHIELMREHGEDIPAPHGCIHWVEV